MKKIKLILLLILVTISYRCDEGLEELNIDPNNAVTVNPSNLLTSSQYSLYNMMAGTTMNADWGLLMVQYWSQNEYTEDSRYNQDITFFNGSWSTFYASIINELTAAKNLVDEQDLSEAIKTNQKNILDVMISQAYINLADGFGAVPYSEAINDEISLPAYDEEEDIYNGVLETLDKAYSSFDSSTGSFASGEIIYNGDVESWKKLTNSLILRYAMRIVDVDESTASEYINKASSNLINSNEENALFTFESNPDRAHPLYRNNILNNRDDYCVSEFLVTTLEDLGDPRLDEFAKPASGGTIVGMPYGINDNDASVLKPTTSRPNDQVREATTSHLIMGYSEVQFLLAEAYQRNILSGNASQAYANAVTSSMNYWNITDKSAIDNYIDNNPYDSSNWKESIGVQKWVAFYMNGFQAWNEWRRLDFPVLSVPSEAVISTIPVKLPYPLSETQNNSENLNKITTTPGDLTTKVWWDVN